MAVANFVTALRLVFFALFIYAAHQESVIGAAIWFALAWSLDAVDGWVARRLGQDTAFGYIFDKAVDRMVLVGGVFVLVVTGLVLPVALLLVVKEMMVILAVVRRRVEGKDLLDMGVLGKVAMLLQGLAVLWLLFELPYALALVVAVSVFGVLVGWRYVERVRAGVVLGAVAFLLLGLSQLVLAQTPAATVVAEKEYSDEVVVNEFLPNPTGSEAEGEFIELKNMGNVEVDLKDWQLDDGEGAYVIPEGTLVEEEQVVVFWRSETKIILNNGGDEVRLFSPNGEEKSSFAYEESVGEDVSYNRRDDGEYVLSTTVTPGEENIITWEQKEEEEEEDDETLRQAQGKEYSDAIVINEFLPNPVGSDAEGEFIELKNMGNVEVDLKDWQLDDGEGGSSAYVIPEGTLIGGGEIVVFLRPETRLALNNGGDEVRLFSPDGEVRDEHGYEESVSEGVARARDEEGVWWWSTTSTPGRANVITRPESEEEDEDDERENREYPDTVVVNEFLPNPTGSDTEAEFIELKNIGDSDVDLEGWEIDDGDGGSRAYGVPAGVSLAAGSYLVFWRSETKIALNNGGDEVRLFSPNGEEKSSFVYEESVGESVSYNRTSSEEYVLSTTVTPGEANIITEPGAEDGEADGGVAGATVVKVSLKDIRGQAVGTEVETEGVVSAPPGIFGDKIMYLAGSGIQVYFYKEEYPELEMGDKVKVRGELATSLGEYRIKLAAADDVLVVGGEVAPEPRRVTTGEVGESLEGSLVIVAGRVTRTSGDTFYVDDGSGEVKVFIKRTTGIDKPKMKKGVTVTIMGVVSRTNAGYRILPRWQGDVRLGLVAGLVSFPGAGWLYPSFGGAGLVAALMLVLARRAGEPLILLTG